MKTLNGRGRPPIENLDKDIERNYNLGVKNSRDIWYAWVDPILKTISPIFITVILLLILVGVQAYWIHDLGSKGRDVPVFMTLVDPSKTKVIQTIQLDTKTMTVDEGAEMQMVKGWIHDMFAVTTDARSAAAQKRRARFRIKLESPAQVKSDAYFSQNDPIKNGVNGSVDVESSITPLIGDHHFSVDGTRQPYDLVGKPSVQQTFKCDVLLAVVLPTTKQEATDYFPYTFVKDYTCTDN